jgi:hypothetical protein
MYPCTLNVSLTISKLVDERPNQAKSETRSQSSASNVSRLHSNAGVVRSPWFAFSAMRVVGIVRWRNWFARLMVPDPGYGGGEH